MAQIPIYISSASPQGQVAPRAQGFEVSDALGVGLQKVGTAGQELANAMQKREAQDEIVNLTKPLAEEHIYWPGRITNDLVPRTTDGGKMMDENGELIRDQSGAPVTLTQQVKQEFETRQRELLDKITSPVAKMYAARNLLSLYQSTLTTAVRTEAHLGVANRTQKLTESVDLYGTLASRDPASVNGSLAAIRASVQGSNLDPIAQQKIVDHATNTLTEMAVQGWIQRNPNEPLAALGQVFGKDIPGALRPPRASYQGSPDDVAALKSLASDFGIDPGDLATVMAYESGIDPSRRGGKNNAHIGVIQFGADEQKKYGAHPGQTFREQLGAVAAYLRDRGLPRGANIETIYRTINGGNPNAPLSASDGNGTIAEHVARMQSPGSRAQARASQFLSQPSASGAQPSDAGQAVAPEPPAANVPPELTALVARLRPERVLPFLHSAQSEVNRQQTVLAAGISSTEADHFAMWQTGKSPPRLLTSAEYTTAYGPVLGPRRFEIYQTEARVASAIGALNTQSPADITATVESFRPDPARPDYAMQQKMHTDYTTAARRVLTQRQEDPMGFAVSVGIQGATQLDLSDPAKFGASLAARQGVADTMRERYQTPYTLLTKDEAKSLASSFQNWNIPQKMQYLKGIAQALPDSRAFVSVMQQIRPDSPVIARAGQIIATERAQVQSGWFSDKRLGAMDVAETLILGEHLLNPSTGDRKQDGSGGNFKMPQDQLLLGAFRDHVGQGFANQPDAWRTAYQSFRAYYAGSASRAGKNAGEYDSSIASESLAATTPMISVSGQKVPGIWGISESNLIDGLKRDFDRVATANGWAGKPGMGSFDNYWVQPSGGGYILMSKTGLPVAGPDGRHITLEPQMPSAGPAALPADWGVPQPRTVDLPPPARQATPPLPTSPARIPIIPRGAGRGEAP